MSPMGQRDELANAPEQLDSVGGAASVVDLVLPHYSTLAAAKFCERTSNAEEPITIKMKTAQISKPGGDWELVEREMPQPDVGQVRVRVEACGVCHSDMFVKEGSWPGIQYPRVPGHEVAGRIDVLGTGVTGWANGQRVA